MGQLLSQLIGKKDISPNDIVIVVIGTDGAGKSTFINTAADKPLLEVSGLGKLEPCTTKVKHVRCTVNVGGSLKQVVFVDTPALPSDGNLADSSVIEDKIQKWSKKTLGKGINFTGILYLYKITDNRMTQPPRHLFEKLRGNGFHGRVLLVTTMWEILKNQEDGKRRKAQLEGHWSQTTDKAVVCHNGTTKSAWGVVEALVR